MTTTRASMYRKLTQEELCAEARAAFGDDPRTWSFRCPHCGDVASPQDFIDAGLDPQAIGQDCIGRDTGARRAKSNEAFKKSGGRGCDWASYGLFRGPWEIVMPNGKSAWSFPLASPEGQP